MYNAQFKNDPIVRLTCNTVYNNSTKNNESMQCLRQSNRCEV